jgi:hypothetical protein
MTPSMGRRQPLFAVRPGIQPQTTENRLYLSVIEPQNIPIYFYLGPGGPRNHPLILAKPSDFKGLQTRQAIGIPSNYGHLRK